MSDRSVPTKQFPFVAAVLGITIVGIYLALYFHAEAWQMAVIAGIVAITAVGLALTPVSVQRHSIPRIESWMMYLPLAACIGGELVLSGATLYNTAYGVLLMTLLKEPRFREPRLVEDRSWGGRNCAIGPKRNKKRTCSHILTPSGLLFIGLFCSPGFLLPCQVSLDAPQIAHCG